MTNPSCKSNQQAVVTKENQPATLSSHKALSMTNHSPSNADAAKCMGKKQSLPHMELSAARCKTDSNTSGSSPSVAKVAETFTQHPFLSYISDYPAIAMPTYRLLSWDTSLCIHLNRYSNSQSISRFFKVISRLGDGWFWGAMLSLALILSFWSANDLTTAVTDATMIGQSHQRGLLIWAPILSTFITSALGVGVYKILKVKTVRPRPYQVHQVIILGERPLDVFSFPSGHTLQAVLFTCALGGYFPILLWVMVPFATLIALSRMVLGLHYPTDVLMGALLGLGLAQLAPFIYSLLVAL